MSYDCYRENVCDNQGKCFKDDRQCPKAVICVCQECFYGSRCQFSTKRTSLSLDTILGYHILPRVAISEQPIIIRISIKACDVGCGFYLFVSSTASMIIVILFTIKFVLLLAIQMSLINNRKFINVKCTFVNYFLRIFATSGDWLSACTAIERTINAWKGIHFNKSKTKN
ncbi:unnamed protein product [Rotaria magnacalcarata]|uniref:EGF-like domain-containing protein n=1 Tax=Rotaria magnacalcarata TaxID=392030 RepID=A0A819MM10_9BILA|nr:unnamed protein product [Rotaria magnacalcarata]